MRKTTFEEIKQILKLKNLTVLDDIYNGAESKIKFCDERGYKYNMQLSNIKAKSDKVSHEFSHLNPYAIENVEHYIKTNVDNGTTLISDSMPKKEKELQFKCGVCGVVFIQRIKVFTNFNPYHCCSDCVLKLKNTRLTPIEDIRNELVKYDLVLIDEKFNGVSELITVKNSIGYITLTKIDSLRTNSLPMWFWVKNPYLYHNIDIYIKNNNLTCSVIDNSLNKHKVDFICECGDIFTVNLDHFFYEDKNRCNKCNRIQSKIENNVEKWLNNNNIEFLKQYRIKECKLKMELPFDFYLIKNNILIEVDGEGHFNPVNFGGISDERALINFNKQKERDLIKDNYCNQNNIKLIRIPYYEIRNNKYQETLSNIIH